MKKKIILAYLCAASLLMFGACKKGGGNGDGGVSSESVSSSEEISSSESVSSNEEISSSESESSSDEISSSESESNSDEISSSESESSNEEVSSDESESSSEEVSSDESESNSEEISSSESESSSEEISSSESDSSSEEEVIEPSITMQKAPTKVSYKVGEAFDPTGMVVVYKYDAGEGDILDNQFLTYTYQTEDGKFALGDTKVTVSFDDLSFDVEITVEKAQAQILGVEESYTTVCSLAPVINATSNVAESSIAITYFDGETEVQAADFVAGKTYTAKISIAETDAALGAETTAQVSVEHGYTWQADAENPDKLVQTCQCGDAKSAYVMNNQTLYVDDTDMSIDLSKLVFGATEYSVKSVQQIQLLNSNAKVDIEGTNEGSVYTFAKENYEKLTEDWTPYYLALSVVYTVDGVDCEVTYTAKYVEKVIRNAEDLLSLAYKGGDTAENGGVAVTGQYVLANDIDASGLTLGVAKHAWQAGIGFMGVFEGNGHTISNLTVPDWTNGLFGALGYNGRVQNVNFTNVKVGNGSHLFALVIRNAYMTNVNVEFAVESTAYSFADSANDTEFANVSILTEKGVNPFKLQENAENPMPETITLNYFTQYSVTFNTDGGNEIAPVSVTVGKKAAKPENPTKASDEEYDYEFLGWFYNDEEFSFDTPITTDIELLAKWTKTERIDETELIALTVNAITALPETVSLPTEIYHVPAISSANASYNQLTEEGKAQVTNYAKLEKLLAMSKGYESVYVPNATGVHAIPCHVVGNPSDVAATGALSSDATHGTTFVATSGAGGRVSIQFSNFPAVSQYDKILFYVRSDKAQGYLYVSEDTGEGGWGTNWTNNYADIEKNYGKNNVVAGAWSLMEFDVSSNVFTANWAMGVWNNATDYTLEIGAVIGYKAPADAGETVDKAEVSLPLGVMTDTGTTNEYGKVYNLSQGQWFIDNNVGNTMNNFTAGQLAAALPAGYDHFEFYLYNPTDTVYRFHLAGDVSGTWTDSEISIDLAAKAWTKVSISAADIELNKGGQWYLYILGGDGAGAAKAGWQVSTAYAVKA